MTTINTNTTATTAYILTPDTTGTFVVNTGSGVGATAMTIDASQNATFAGNATVSGNLNVVGKLGLNSLYGTSGQVLTTQGSGSAPVWADAQSMTLLGTIPTTSGTAVSLSGLNLTGYKYLRIFIEGVSTSAGTAAILFVDSKQFTQGNGAASNGWYGVLDIELATGLYVSTVNAAAALTGGAAGSFAGQTSYSNATTTLSFTMTGGTSLDAGALVVYGVK